MDLVLWCAISFITGVLVGVLAMLGIEKHRATELGQVTMSTGRLKEMYNNEGRIRDHTRD